MRKKVAPARRTPHPAPSARDVDAIRALAGPAWSAAWRAADATALAEFYTEDAILLPQNQPPIIGKEEIRAGYQAVFEEFRVSGASEIQELEVGGEWAFLRGSYVIQVTPKAGGPPLEEDRGHWLWIARRQRGGGWKIARAIGASTNPLPPGGESGSRP